IDTTAQSAQYNIVAVAPKPQPSKGVVAPPPQQTQKPPVRTEIGGSVQPVGPVVPFVPKPSPGYQLSCPQGYSIVSGRCTPDCAPNTIFTFLPSSCGTPTTTKCDIGLVLNPVTKQCEKQTDVKCPKGQVNHGGVCVDDQLTCKPIGKPAADKSQCCSGKVQNGLCSNSDATGDPINCKKIGEPA